MPPFNRQTLERLMQYYHCINEQFVPESRFTVSSARFARCLSLDGTQVRKDLAAIGVKGRRRVGFDVNTVLEAIQRTLGLTQTRQAVVIGAGRLGGAIASYKGFKICGLDIVALFDVNPGKIGLSIAGHVVQPLEQLESIIKDRGIEMGILTVPAGAAQPLADRLVNAGIKAIWNFSAVALTVSEEIIVRHEHLSIGLAQLSYHLKRLENHR